MAGKTAQIYTRMEPDLKKRALRILNELGISTTDAIRIYFQQIVDSNGIPFEVSIANAKTRHAMNDARKGKDLTSYDSPEEFFKANNIWGVG